MNTFQWKWNAANGNDIERLKQIRAANQARIAQLQSELGGLNNTDRMTDQDMLDLELASNRARAYDIANSVNALGRIDERRAERWRDARETARINQTRTMENELKISELQKQYQQELNSLSNSATAQEDAQHKTNLKYLGERIQQLGGEIPGGGNIDDYRTRHDIYADYYGNTENTKTGRKFRDTVDGAKREQLVADLRSIGEFEKADALQATSTPEEIDKANQAEKEKRRALRAKVVAITKKMKEVNAAYSKAAPKSDEQFKLLGEYQKLQDAADSLARNYGDYVKIENGNPRYVAKD